MHLEELLHTQEVGAWECKEKEKKKNEKKRKVSNINEKWRDAVNIEALIFSIHPSSSLGLDEFGLFPV